MTVLLETRHVKAALSAVVVRTDRKDARGIAQEVRALLIGRKLLPCKLCDVEFSIRGLLRGFGLKVGVVSKGRFAARVQEPVEGHAISGQVVEVEAHGRLDLGSRPQVSQARGFPHFSSRSSRCGRP